MSARTLGTGKEQHIISSSSNMSKEDIDRAVKDAEQFAEQDKKRREEVDTENNAENLLLHRREAGLRQRRQDAGFR